MSGEAPLVGERLQRALRMLRSVTDVLDAAGVRYWLDSGTLLGVVREQRLLPWDTDMDISVDSKDVGRLLQCLPSIRHSGERIRTRMKNHLVDSPACPAGSPRLLKVRNRKWKFFRGDLLLDVFILHRAGDRYHWSIGHGTGIRHLCAPARHFDTLDSIEFDGKRYPVPSEHESYLAYRYGNWRVPERHWSCFKDDLAILPGEATHSLLDDDEAEAFDGGT